MEKYRVVEPIGKGSFGVVNLVESKDGLRCVMKTIELRGLKTDERQAAEREVLSLLSIQH